MKYRKIYFVGLVAAVASATPAIAVLIPPTHVTIDISSIISQDLQLEFGLFDNSDRLGDSWVLIDNVRLGGTLEVDFETGTLQGFDASLNPDSVTVVNASIDGTGCLALRMDEDLSTFVTFTWRDFAGSSAETLEFDVQMQASTETGLFGLDEFVTNVLDPATLNPLLPQLPVGGILAISSGDLVHTTEVSVEATRVASPRFALNTVLSLMPVDLDLTQERRAAIATKVKFDIWNANEVRFSGTKRCIICWDQTLLSRYGFPNHFLLGNLHTDKGRARIDGVASTVCRSGATPLLAVAVRELSFGGCREVSMRSAVTPIGIGSESARILYDIIRPPDQFSGQNMEPTERLGLQLQREIDPMLQVSSSVADRSRGSVSKKGSLLIWPRVELRWDLDDNLIQDTFLDISNDFPDDTRVRLYFVNGDPPLDAVFVGDPPILAERAHPGWNNVDIEIELTSSEPTYWSAATGQPAGVSSLTILDPGVPPGRPDPDARNSGGRLLRGFVVGWAVDSEGKEVNWNHLSGGATVINYADRTASEYNAWAFQCLTGVDLGEECGDEAGELNLDGFEYDACPAKLLLDFYAVGSMALSHPDVR